MVESGALEALEAQAALHTVIRNGHRPAHGNGLLPVGDDAGVARDDHGDPAVGFEGVAGRLLDGAGHLGQVIGVHHPQELDPAAFHHSFDRDGLTPASIGPQADTRGGLHSGHGGDFVVEDHQDKACVVVDGVDQPGGPGMEEGRIADGGDDGLGLAVGCEGVVEACGHGDAGAHVEARVDGPEVEPEGVAADVRGEDGLGLGLAYGEERGPVRAPGAQGGPAHRQAEAFHQRPHPEVGAGGKRLQAGVVQGPVQDRGDPLGNEFAFGRDMSGQAAQDLFPVAQEVFDEGVGFLQDQDPVAPVHEGIGRFVGKRKRSPEFEDRDIGAALLCQQVGHGGARHPPGHDAQGDPGGRGGARIERREGLEAPLDGFELLVQFAVELQPEFWCGGPAQGVPLEDGLPGSGCDRPPGHVLPGVADPDRRPKDDRKAEFRRKVHRGLHHLPGFLGRGGIEDRHLGKARHEARVLFGLGGVRPRIVA